MTQTAMPETVVPKTATSKTAASKTATRPQPETQAGICEVERLGPRHVEPSILFEIPHGATLGSHYDALRPRLSSTLPEGIEGVFHMNTDIGAPEVSRWVAERLADAGIASMIVRCSIPRTFIDCNRVLDQTPDGAVTQSIPDYIDSDADQAFLRDLHRRYTEVAEAAYATVCGSGGLALTVHTYAPRSVQILQVKHSIVEELRAAYEPDVYDTWPVRPPVDLITRDRDGALLAPPELLAAVREHYTAQGVDVTENHAYRLFDVTMGYHHSARWPGRVLCLELRRDLLAEEFLPFRAMTIDPQKVERMAQPLAEALLANTR